MTETLSKRSRNIAWVLLVIAVIYFGGLVHIIVDSGWQGDVSLKLLALVGFLLVSPAAPFLTLVGLAKRWRWLYVVLSIWFALLALFFGRFTIVFLPGNAMATPLPIFLAALIPCVLCAALSYLQARLYLQARGGEAEGATT
jgi:hypothetical protein